ncbi:hypothetical protein ACQ86N_07395 [Puia sp. P3]|uniref:hypothetical protein n=1 Tax=Puia sp. P3 TaxID=3423952 RepID=UPI003D67D076
MSNGNVHIRFLEGKDIDARRWDACIEKASNRLVYGFHFYLDHMAGGQWSALVLGDYQAVMPLPGDGNGAFATSTSQPLPNSSVSSAPISTPP